MESKLERQLRLVELASATGSFRFSAGLKHLQPISTATLTRLLRELEATGLLVRYDDGTYALGQRHDAWSDAADISTSLRAHIDDLAQDLQCTATWWSVHSRAQRCRHRCLDEFSPSFAAAGTVRPLLITAGGGGLFMTYDELTNDALLQSQAARTPLQPDLKQVRAVARSCLRNRVYDDRGLFYPGCRRIAVPTPGSGILACAFASRRFQRAATVTKVVTRLQVCAQSAVFVHEA